MFKIAEQRAQNDHVALVSSDIFLFPNTLKALDVCRRKFKDFCAVCRKRQQREFKVLNFENKKEWYFDIHQGLRWNLITSGDFYMYNKGFWGEIPKFVIGRCACDTWLFWEASRRGQMVDLTEAMSIIDYQHKHEHWDTKGDGVGELERRQNVKMAGEIKASIKDANWIMDRHFEITEKK